MPQCNIKFLFDIFTRLRGRGFPGASFYARKGCLWRTPYFSPAPADARQEEICSNSIPSRNTMYEISALYIPSLREGALSSFFGKNAFFKKYFSKIHSL